jgi:filamentous hemagglutinin
MPEDAASLAKLSGMLREAAQGKGNFRLGTTTRREAEALGRAWVGEGYTVASDGQTLVSLDRLRQYRPPSYKPRLGQYQANLEQRQPGHTQWYLNAHIDIED